MPIKTKEQLKDRYGAVSPRAEQKEQNELDKHFRHFISLSPFLVIASSAENGQADASPKGDAPGFVQVIDDKTLLIPDRPGNNRTDSLLNILENPEVGLVFFVPGLRETLRVNGTCEILDDPETLAQLTAHGKPPISALKITIREIYMHCGKAVIRSKLWADDYKIQQNAFPSLGKILADQIGNMDVRQAEKSIEQAYEKKLY